MQVRDHRKIKRLLIVQNASARQLAASLGCNHSYVNRVLSGERPTVTPEMARKIARFLHVDVDDLFVPRVSTSVGRSASSRKAG